jgi:hypothetical protein
MKRWGEEKREKRSRSGKRRLKDVKNVEEEKEM